MSKFRILGNMNEPVAGLTFKLTPTKRHPGASESSIKYDREKYLIFHDEVLAGAWVMVLRSIGLKEARMEKLP